MTQGIYAIVHVASGRRYVGRSVRIDERFATHRRLLRKGTHHCAHLQAAWNCYGEDSFVFCVIEKIADGKLLLNTEQALLDNKDAVLFNSSRSAKAPEPQRGIALSAETKEKLRVALSGREFSLETRAKISAKATGRILPSDVREKISASKRGRRNANLARVPTHKQIVLFTENVMAVMADPVRKAQWRRRNSEGHKGKPWSAARRAAYVRMKNDLSRRWTNSGRSWSDARRAHVKTRPEAGL